MEEEFREELLLGEEGMEAVETERDKDSNS